MTNGVITIRFYANDTLGNIGFKDVNVLKDTPLSQNGGDGDIDLGLINSAVAIGTMITVSAVFILLWRGWKISKKKRFFH